MAKSKPIHRSLKEIKRLGKELLSSRAHINNLPLLLPSISPTSPPSHVLESLLSLQSFFTPLLPDLPPSSAAADASSGENAARADAIYNSWLRSKFDEFVANLLDVVVSADAEEALREIVLDAVMEVVKVGNRGRFHSAIYHRLLVNLVQSTAPVDFLLDVLVAKYFTYIDVRYFTYISLEKLAKTLEGKDVSGSKTEKADRDEENHSKASIELSIHKIHYIISRIPALEDPNKNADYELWSDSGFSSKESKSKEDNGPSKAKDTQLKSEKPYKNVLTVANITKKIKLKFTKAWISFLKLPLPLDVYKEVLLSLHQVVIPRILNPLILSDFLTRSYDIGGVVSVMALSSLYILMTDHGLEYPNFYEKLYALLLPSTFMAKYRAKFFELLDACLKSQLLPAYLAAAFAKKLSRLSLVVPPSGALVIIALIHNLLRRHPSINCLVHKEDGNDPAHNNALAEGKDAGDANDSGVDTSARKCGIDYFNIEESDLAKSNALRSSLWEMDTLRHHYCPPVSRFVVSLETDLTVRAKTAEVTVSDFSSGSYATIFGEEIRRRVKQVPLAFYKATPTSLFSESDFAGWTFNQRESVENNSEIGALNLVEGKDHSPVKRQRTECS